jgi:hypothetical protein
MDKLLSPFFPRPGIRSRSPSYGISTSHFLKVSFHGPPIHTSPPALPLISSSPPPPRMQSLPPLPFIKSASGPPRINSLSLVPVQSGGQIRSAVRSNAAHSEGLMSLTVMPRDESSTFVAGTLIEAVLADPTLIRISPSMERITNLRTRRSLTWDPFYNFSRWFSARSIGSWFHKMA